MQTRQIECQFIVTCIHCDFLTCWAQLKSCFSVFVPNSARHEKAQQSFRKPAPKSENTIKCTKCVWNNYPFVWTNANLETREIAGSGVMGRYAFHGANLADVRVQIKTYIYILFGPKFSNNCVGVGVCGYGCCQRARWCSTCGRRGETQQQLKLLKCTPQLQGHWLKRFAVGQYMSATPQLVFILMIVRKWFFWSNH